MPLQDNTIKPIRKKDVIVQTLGHETFLCNAGWKAVHVLNSTAKLIWELCDGSHTLKDMEQAIRTNFSVARGRDVSGDIQKILEVFSNKELLEKIV